MKMYTCELRGGYMTVDRWLNGAAIPVHVASLIWLNNETMRMMAIAQDSSGTYYIVRGELQTANLTELSTDWHIVAEAVLYADIAEGIITKADNCKFG